jgi:hypothetical protein
MPGAALVASAALLAACGGADKQAPPPPPAPSAAQVQRAASATRKAHLDEIVSEYLGELRNSPAAARNARIQSLTGGQLGSEIAGAPAACGQAVSKIIGVVGRADLGGPAKAKRITTAMDAVHASC